MFDIAVNILWESWALLGEMSPYLLFGFLVAGVLSVCISPEFVERHLGGRGFAPVLKAALFGVPLPLCSCGVIPVAASFRRHGASRAATTSFLLSTPQTGVDSIAATYALLGAVFAFYRPIVALITGLVGGLLVMLIAQRNHADEPVAAKPEACQESCCADRGSRNIVRRAIEYGFVVLPRDIGFALLVGVVIAGAITVFVPPDQLHPYLGGGVVAILLMMAIGTPLYVCATASVPIAAALLEKGASPGAALAFLIAGPATNSATIMTVWKLLGGRTVTMYLLTIALSAVGGGLALDALMPAFDTAGLHLPAHCHDAMAGGTWASSLWAIALLAVLAYSYARKPRDEANHAAEHSHGDNTNPSAPLQEIQMAITGMTCSHCAAAVVRALTECAGVASANVDLAAGRATITGANLDSSRLLDAVTQLGYTAKIA